MGCAPDAEHDLRKIPAQHLQIAFYDKSGAYEDTRVIKAKNVQECLDEAEDFEVPSDNFMAQCHDEKLGMVATINFENGKKTTKIYRNGFLNEGKPLSP